MRPFEIRPITTGRLAEMLLDTMANRAGDRPLPLFVDGREVREIRFELLGADRLEGPYGLDIRLMTREE